MKTEGGAGLQFAVAVKENSASNEVIKKINAIINTNLVFILPNNPITEYADRAFSSNNLDLG